jgi:hypothetical protein
MMRRIVLTETASGLTYTGVTSVPAGARITDVLMETFSAWAAATLDIVVGDSDAPDALIGNTDVSAVGFATAAPNGGSAWGDSGGNGNPYSNAMGLGTGKLYPSGDLITVIGTATTPAGPTGLTYVTLLIELGSIVRQSTVV